MSQFNAHSYSSFVHRTSSSSFPADRGKEEEDQTSRASSDRCSFQVSIYDSADRLLNDSARLKEISSSSSSISLRFTMINTITSLAHCHCVSPSSVVVEKARLSSSSSSPTLIRRETIARTLSTCPLIPTPPQSPVSSLSPVLAENPMSIVNLLTPPSPVPYSSFLIDNLVESTNRSIIDQITSEFGEICPVSKPKRTRPAKKAGETPLDLTLKKRPPSFDLFPSQSKWLKMI